MTALHNYHRPKTGHPPQAVPIEKKKIGKATSGRDLAGMLQGGRAQPCCKQDKAGVTDCTGCSAQDDAYKWAMTKQPEMAENANGKPSKFKVMEPVMRRQTLFLMWPVAAMSRYPASAEVKFAMFRTGSVTIIAR